MFTLVQISPGTDDGERLPVKCRRMALFGGSHRPQGSVLLTQVIPQVQGELVAHFQAIGFHQLRIHHANRLSCICRGKEAAFITDDASIRHPADGSHVVPIDHIEGMHVVVGDLNEFPQRGIFFCLQPSFLQIGDIREIRPPAFAEIVTHVKHMGQSQFIIAVLSPVTICVTVSENEDIPPAHLQFLHVRQEIIRVKGIEGKPCGIVEHQNAVILSPALIPGRPKLQLLLLVSSEPCRIAGQYLTVRQRQSKHTLLCQSIAERQQSADVKCRFNSFYLRSQDAAGVVCEPALIRIQTHIFLGYPSGHISPLCSGNIRHVQQSRYRLCFYVRQVKICIVYLSVGFRRVGWVCMQKVIVCTSHGFHYQRNAVNGEYTLIPIPGLLVLPAGNTVF